MGKCWPSFWPTYLLTALNSARVDLDSNGDAIEPYQIMNCRIEGAQMRGVGVGTWDTARLNLRVDAIWWPGNATDTPVTADMVKGEQ